MSPPQLQSVDSSPSTDTRHHLLRAAISVFAESGFREATIREICQRAGTNVASVNYHFGDKEGLYEEVLRVCREDPQNPRIHMEMDPSTPAAVRLEAYVRWMFRRVLASEEQSPLGQMLTREMIEPTPALGRIVEVHIRPEAVWLGALFRELMGSGFSPIEVARASMSLVGQIVFYKHCHSLLTFLSPAIIPRPGSFEDHVRQITEFTLAGIDGMRAQRRAAGAAVQDGSDKSDLFSASIPLPTA